jgi:hypothetical protein
VRYNVPTAVMPITRHPVLATCAFVNPRPRSYASNLRPLNKWKIKGKAIRTFVATLAAIGQAANNTARIHIPSNRGTNQVGQAKGVETTAESNACDTVKHGGNPCYLRLVDREMRGDGAQATLGDEH